MKRARPSVLVVLSVALVAATFALGGPSRGGSADDATRCPRGPVRLPTPSADQILLEATAVFVGTVTAVAHGGPAANRTDIEPSAFYTVEVAQTVRGDAAGTVTVAELSGGLPRACMTAIHTDLVVGETALFAAESDAAAPDGLLILVAGAQGRVRIGDEGERAAALAWAEGVLLPGGTPAPVQTFAPTYPDATPWIIDGTPVIVFA
jgi:hypothetical protein